jgi:hypothetical protein
MMLPQPTAKRTLTFKQRQLEVTAIVSSFVRKRLTADTIQIMLKIVPQGMSGSPHR